jgi:hypothetical protein
VVRRIQAEASRRFRRRKAIRYVRWTVKAAFVALFMLPVAYLLNAPSQPVYSLIVGGFSQPLGWIPMGQSVCVMWTVAYGYIGSPFAWLMCPVGGFQTLLTRQVDALHFWPTVLALLLFLLPVFVLGNVFCGWVCPLGSVIDAFDKAVEVFMPNLDRRREARKQRGKTSGVQQKTVGRVGAVNRGFAVCVSCPFGRLLQWANTNVATSVLAASLVGSAFFRFPVFCTVCPIGISTRGMFHLKAVTSITGTRVAEAAKPKASGVPMPVILEFLAVPVLAVLLSLREKRYWCRKICPVGAALNLAGSVSPFIRPTVEGAECVMKGCPKSCEDYKFDFCMMCREWDKNRCVTACPLGINLLENESLVKCVKCFECYIQCERCAVKIKPCGMPDVVLRVKRFFYSRRRKHAAA